MDALPKFKIAAPCNARWEEMTGDERSRFCGQCEKQVYNFSKMNPDEITQLVSQNGTVCARFYQRSDGTVLLENCPVGTERIYRKVKIAVCSIVAFFVFGLGICVASIRGNQRSETYDRVATKWDDTVWTIKGWLGFSRPMLLMGEPCVVAPAPAPSTNQTSASIE